MSNDFDRSTLGWVKTEIDETLTQARQALEAYVEDPNDEAQLRFCLTYLHQVHGTLKMVELYGAVMLADEMEHLAQGLIDKTITQKDDAFEVLMRAILQLPDYLERLQGGNPDQPLVLLPLLNDLRAARNEALLSESAFFSPDLSVMPPSKPGSGATSGMGDLAALAKKLRHLYQLGLVGWFRDRDVDGSLAKLAQVTDELRTNAGLPKVSQLFWIANGVIDGLVQGALVANVSLKLLLGQVDRQIKKIIDNGEQAVSVEQPIELLKNLLYYAASAEPRGDKLKEVRAAFNLEILLPPPDQLTAAQESLGGVNEDVLRTVAAAVKEDIARIKDEIDLFVRTDERNIAKLAPLSNELKKVADTLGMVGLGLQRSVVTEQESIIGDIVAGELHASDDILMEMARAFLFIDTSLNELRGRSRLEEEHGNAVLRGLKRLHGESVDEEAASEQDSRIAEAEYQQVLQAVIREAKIDVGRVKDLIVSFITAPWEHKLLEEVPQLNKQVRGSLSMLTLEDAAGLLESCTRYIEKDLIEKKNIPDQDTLDTLADAITSIEYYLEALEENRRDREGILDIARASVAKLGYPSERPGAELEPVAGEIVPGVEEAAIPDSSPEAPLDIPRESPTEAAETSLEHEEGDGGVVAEQAPDAHGPISVTRDLISAAEKAIEERALREKPESIEKIEFSPPEESGDAGGLTLEEFGEESGEFDAAAEAGFEAPSAEIEFGLPPEISESEPIGGEIPFAAVGEAGEPEIALELPEESGEPEITFELPEESGEPEITLSAPEETGEPEFSFELPEEASEPEISFELPEEAGEPEITLSTPEGSLEPEFSFELPEEAPEPEISFELPEDAAEPEITFGLPEESGEPEITLGAPEESDEAEFSFELSEEVSAPEFGLGLPEEAGESEITFGLPEESGEPEITLSAPEESGEAEFSFDLSEEFSVPEIGVGLPDEAGEPETTLSAPEEGGETEFGFEASEETAEPEISFEAPAEGAGPEFSFEAPAESAESEFDFEATAESVEPEIVLESPAESAEPDISQPAPDEPGEPEIVLATPPEADERETVIAGLQEAAEPEGAAREFANAEELLACLRTAVDAWISDVADEPALEDIRICLVHPLIMGADVPGQEKIANITSEMGLMVEIIAGGDGELDDDVRNTLVWAVDALYELLGVAKPVSEREVADETPASAVSEELKVAESESEPAPLGEVSEAPTAPPQPVVSAEELSRFEDEVDEEIKEIFFEEADEELASLNEHFPRWKANNEDEEALTTVRRSFHTLKGSSRMVGAEAIGEFAWAFENLLNRIIDKTVAASPEVFELIESALLAMPGLVNHFKGGPPPEYDILGLTDEAFDQGKLARARERVSASAPATPAATAAPPPLPISTPGEAEAGTTPDAGAERAAEAVEEPETSGMDPVLVEIFTNESKRHLATIAAFMDACKADAAACAVSDDLIRAIHTLHGSAHMAGVGDIAELSNNLEKLVKTMHGAGLPADEDGLTLLSDCAAAIDTRLEQLGDLDAVIANQEALLDRISRAEDEASRAVPRTPEPYVPEISPPLTPAPAMEEPEAHEPVSDEDFDDELLEIFLEEGAEILDASEETLHNWVADKDDKNLQQRLQREIHTLKGGARMAGINPIGDLSHALEAMIIAVVENRVDVSDSVFKLIQLSHDKLLTMLEQVRDRKPVIAEDTLVAKVEALTAGKEIELEDAPAAEPVPESVSTPEVDVTQQVASADESEPRTTEQVPELQSAEVIPIQAEEVVIAEVAEEPAFVPAPEPDASTARAPQEQIRVRADLLDNLVNFAGEASIYRSRIEQQVGAFRYNLTEMDQTVHRLREQLRRFEIETEAQIIYRFEESGQEYDGEFDPLEMDRFSQMQQLSRSLVETLGDLVSIQGLLDNQARGTETLLLQQSRVNTDLQEGLMRTRMVPFSTQLPRLRRIARQTTSELGKEAELLVIGAEGELDRTVLDRLLPPLEHMVRNAIDHGIEMPKQRVDAGKSPKGTIRLDINREGTEIVVRMKDDGAGIDLDAIRAKAMERGLLNKDSDLTDKETLRFILESGFSTARKVTQISGRGVGMDVVNSEIKQLGGTLAIDTKRGRGTTFTVRLPLTLAINKALLVMVGDEVFAIPISVIEAVVRAGHEELEAYYASKDPNYEYGGNVYRFMHLGAALGVSQPILPDMGSKLPVLLVRAGDHRVALQIEGLMGSRDIVVKSVGPQISTVRAVSGATILADGRVALILDIGSLVLLDAAQHATAAEVVAEEPVLPAQPTIMVVDDSITVRKVTTRLLERNNLQVLTAKDGVDAVAQLQEHTPDLFLLDIEMPRMDGFELATHIRNHPRLKHIPIIMITSRTGDKHRQRAMAIGVNHYLGKPYQESDLMENIRALLPDMEKAST